MSRRVAGYEGRRPVYVDEGPSAASSGDGLASLSRLSVFAADGDQVDRSIERRQIIAAEIAARAREPKPDHLTRGVAGDGHLPARPVVPQTNAERMQASRLRGARRHVEAVAASKAVAPVWRAAVIAQEELAMDTEPPQDPEAEAADPTIPLLERMAATGASSPLERLAEAAIEAQAALEGKVAAELAWSIAQEALAAVWLEVKGGGAPASLDAAGVVRPSATARAPRLVRDLPAEHRAAAPAVTPSRRPRGPLTERQREVLDAVIRTGDRRLAADQLHTTVQGINAALRDIGEKGGLTPQVMPFLPAGIRAKYAPAEAST